MTQNADVYVGKDVEEKVIWKKERGRGKKTGNVSEFHVDRYEHISPPFDRQNHYVRQVWRAQLTSPPIRPNGIDSEMDLGGLTYPFKFTNNQKKSKERWAIMLHIRAISTRKGEN